MSCKIPNWAPVLDFQMLDFHHEWHDVILACSGYGKHGSIRELRRAIGVNVITKTEPDFNGYLNIYLLFIYLGKKYINLNI